MRIERLALAALLGAIGGYWFAKTQEHEDDIDWLSEWEIEVPPEHQRDNELLMQEPIEWEGDD